MEVDEETGQVIDRSQKAFSKKVLASRVLLKEEKKESEKRKNSVEKMREDNILKSKSFLTEELKSKRSKSSKSPKDGTIYIGTSLKNDSNKRGRPKNTSSEIPSTSTANTDAKIQKTQSTEISLSSNAIDIGAGDNEESIIDREEIIDDISPKNVCFIPGGLYTSFFLMIIFN